MREIYSNIILLYTTAFLSKINVGLQDMIYKVMILIIKVLPVAELKKKTKKPWKKYNINNHQVIKWS